MPLDVLIEIMNQLDPKTLLAMSRTCSVFRRVLHSDGGVSAWKSARRNVALGDLERPDVREWELAQLLFDKTCVVCGKARAITVDYVLFVRGCADCMRANSKRRVKLDENLYHDDALDLVPYSTYACSRNATAEALKGKPKRLAKFIESRKHIQTQARADGQMVQRWISRSKMIEEGIKEDKRAARVRKIKENLRLEGYDERDLATGSLNTHPDVNNGRELTKTVWKRIKPILTSLLDTERSRRLANEAANRQRARAFALKSYYRQIETSLPPASTSDLRAYYPPFANFLSLPSVQPLYLPEGLVPSSDDLTAAIPSILAEIQEFAKDLQNAFFSGLFSAHTALDPDFAVEDLSTRSCLAAVKCPSKSCNTYATFPTILEHSRLCCGDRIVITDDTLVTTPVQIQTIRQILDAVNSSSTPHTGSASLATPMSESSSVAELYALGDTFECETCEAEKGGNAALGVATWSTAYKTKELNWVALLNHVKAKHAEGSASIKYTRPVPPLVDPQSLVDLDEDDEGSVGIENP